MRYIHTLFQSLLALLVLGTVACTKSREASFAPNEGRDLLAIQEYDGKSLEIQTHELLGAVSTSSAPTKSGAKQPDGSQYGFVKYDSVGLMDEAPFKGKPNSKYKIIYRIEGKILMLLKVSEKSELQTSELQSSRPVAADDKNGIKEGLGLVEVPLMGYPITGFYTIEKRKNDLDEDTSRLQEVSQNSKEQATYFRIDRGGRELFKAVDKKDYFAKEYFDGEWYFNATVVSNGRLAANSYADLMDMFGFEGAGRVKFNFTEKAMVGLSQNVDEKIKTGLRSAGKGGENNERELQDLKTIFSIPVQHKDYRIAVRGKSLGLNEEEIADSPWNHRKFVQLDLAQLSPAFQTSSLVELSDIDMTEDYFSFTLLDREGGTRVVYSLLGVKAFEKKSADYVAKTYPKSDRNLFGFFEVHRDYAQTAHTQRQVDLDSNIFVSRFNPRRTEIVYHFSKETPDWIKPAGREAIAEWNKAFKLAAQGSGSTQVPEIKLDETKTVELGDLRENILNLFERPVASERGSWLGLGPSTVDAGTGQIVSAAANVDVAATIDMYQRTLRAYIRHKAGLLDKNYVITLLDQAPPGTESSSGSSSGQSAKMAAGTTDLSQEIDFMKQGPSNDDLLKKVQKENDPSVLLKANRRTPFFNPQKGAFDLTSEKSVFFELLKRSENKSIDNNGKAQALDPFRQMQKRGIETVSVAYSNIISRVEKTPECKVLADNAADFGKNNKLNLEEKAIDTCARRLALDNVKLSLMHEMGHNFGLRHNFAGSSDWMNYPGRKGNDLSGVKMMSSSIMDYFNVNDDVDLGVGPYDIAAIRYGYFDAVESKNGEIQKIGNKEAQEGLNTQGNLRPYRYCTDIDAYYSHLDPMCNRFDSGYEPLAVVKSLIQGYNADVALTTYKYERSSVPSSAVGAYRRLDRYLLPLKRFYEEWRIQLYKALYDYRYTPDANKYLENFHINPDGETKGYAANDRGQFYDYDFVLEKLKTENADFKMAFDRYYTASRLIHQFFTTVAFTPDLSCVVQMPQANQAPIVDLIPLQPIQEQARLSGRKIPTDCSQALDWIRKQSANLDKAELYPAKPMMGLPNYDFSFGTSSMDMISQPDVAGYINDKAMAFSLMVSRYPENWTLFGMGYYPNMLDEPDLAVDIGARVLDRIKQGLQLSEIGIQDSSTLYSTNILTERPLLEHMYIEFYLGQFKPGKIDDMLKKRKLFKLSLDLDDKRNAVKPQTEDRIGIDLVGTQFYASPDRTFVYTLLKRLKNLKVMKNHEAFAIKIHSIANLHEKMMPLNTAVTVGQFMSFMKEVDEAAAGDKTTDPSFGQVAKMYLDHEYVLRERVESVARYVSQMNATRGQTNMAKIAEQFSKEKELDPVKTAESLKIQIEKSNSPSQLDEAFLKMNIEDFIKIFASDLRVVDDVENGTYTPKPLVWDLNKPEQQERFWKIAGSMMAARGVYVSHSAKEVDAQIDMLLRLIQIDAGL